jgi:hypothetical protein
MISRDYVTIRAATKDKCTAIMANCKVCRKEIEIPWLMTPVPCDKVLKDIESNLVKKGWYMNKKGEAFCPEHNPNGLQETKKRADGSLSDLLGKSTTCDKVFNKKAGDQQ